MTEKLILSEQQINTFQTFGFMKFPGLLADRVDEITSNFARMYEEHEKDVISWVHEAHYNKVRQVLMQIIERDASFASIVDDPRIDGIFSSLLGDDYIYRTSEGNIFSGNTYWHTDLYNIDYRYQHLKMALYLDPVDSESGCLRVLPGSHHWTDSYAKMLERDIYEPEKNYGISPEEIPGYPIPSQPGDVLLFDFRIKHATCHSGDHRRMLTVCASQRFKQEHLPDLAKLVEELYAYSGNVFQQAMIDSASPERQAKLDQCLACESMIDKSVYQGPPASSS